MKKTASRITFLTGLLILFASPLLAAGGLNMGDVKIHGFVSQGYIQSSANDFYLAETDKGTYEFNEMGIQFSSSVADKLRIGVQLLSRDLGSVGNNDVDVDWAYADYRYRNWLGLRVGKIKNPMGLFNQYRDIDATRTCIFLPPIAYREDARDTALAIRGVGLYGTLPGRIEYKANYGILNAPKDGGAAQILENQLGSQFGGTADVTDTEADPIYSAWLKWNTPLSGLGVGASTGNVDLTWNVNIATPAPVGGGAYMNANLPFVNAVTGQSYRAFAQFQRNNLMLAAEYGWSELDVDTTILGFTTTTVNDNIDWFIMATYRFAPWFELGTYYTEGYADEDDKDGSAYALMGQPKELAWLKDWAISTRFDINMNWIFKLEAHLMDGLMNVDYGTETDPSENWQMYAAKLTYIF
ncbi:MAG: hypothetical protein SWH61_09575 [Thermodesulfobacteriota bacterium]|nr:hypothetical protein [Thermodesulfobacteriota bacterium]